MKSGFQGSRPAVLKAIWLSFRTQDNIAPKPSEINRCLDLLILFCYFVNVMKKQIHPKYNPEAQAVCACGRKFVVGSTVDQIKTEVCGFCHPFYTGEQKFIDVQGQVQKFQARLAQKKTGRKKK